MAKKRRRKELDDNICPLCKCDMAVRCTGHSRQPFVDGKKYEAICHTCWAVPKTWYYIEETDSFDGPYFDFDHLYTAEELAKDGFDLKAAKTSLKAIKTSINKYKARIKGKL